MPNIFQDKKPSILGLREAPGAPPTQKPGFASLARENNGPGFFGGNFINNRARSFPAEQAFQNAAPQAQEVSPAFNTEAASANEDVAGPRGYGTGIGSRFMGGLFNGDASRRHGNRRRFNQRFARTTEFRDRMQDLMLNFRAELGLPEDVPLSKDLLRDFRKEYKDQIFALRNEYLPSRFARFGQQESEG